MGRKVIIGAIFLSFALIMLYVFSGGDDGYDWAQRFRLQEDEPYDCSLVYQLSKDVYPEVEAVKTSIYSEEVFGSKQFVDRFFERVRSEDIRYWDIETFYENTEWRIEEAFGTKQPDYIFVDRGMRSLSQYDIFALLVMAKNGSNVIFSNYFFRAELETLFGLTIQQEKYSTTEDSTLSLQYEGQSYSFASSAAGSFYFEPSQSDELMEHEPYLFDEKNQWRAVKYKIGKQGGTVHFLSVPIVFTNYYMLKDSHYKISESILKKNENEKLLWGNDYASTVRSEQHDEDPFAELQFIREHESLSWALFLGLGCLAFFMVLRIKRPQRFVPIVELPKNSSLQFIDTLTLLYLQRGNHYEIAAKKINYFLESIRSRYNLQTKDLDEAFVETLLRKTTVAEDDIRTLVGQINEIRSNHKVDERSLKLLIARIKTFKKQI